MYLILSTNAQDYYLPIPLLLYYYGKQFGYGHLGEAHVYTCQDFFFLPLPHKPGMGHSAYWYGIGYMPAEIFSTGLPQRSSVAYICEISCFPGHFTCRSAQSQGHKAANFLPAPLQFVLHKTWNLLGSDMQERSLQNQPISVWAGVTYPYTVLHPLAEYKHACMACWFEIKCGGRDEASTRWEMQLLGVMRAPFRGFRSCMLMDGSGARTYRSM